MVELAITPLVIYLMVDKPFYVGITQRGLFVLEFFLLILGDMQLENEGRNTKFFCRNK